MSGFNWEYKTRSSSSKTVDEMIKETISIQEDLLKGVKKTGKDGNPVRSWFLDDGVTFKPMIGNVGWTVDTSTKKNKVGSMNWKNNWSSKNECLSEFKKMYEEGKFKSQVEDLKKRLKKD